MARSGDRKREVVESFLLASLSAFSITLTAATAVSTSTSTSTAPPQASTTTPSLFSSVAESEDDHYGSLVAVTAVRGATAKLPCDVSSINPDDPVLLVLWYKNASLTPVYSFDSRRREERISTSSWAAGRGRQWADEWVWGKGRRVWFDASTSPAHLVVQPVGGRDEGNYRCKVHFRSSPSWSQKITLTVKDPPGYPRLQDPSGRRLEGPIGPYNQGTTVTLICLASGDPRPGLVWGGDALTVGKAGKMGEGGAAGIAGQSRAVLQVVASRQTSGANITCSTTASVIPSTPSDVIVITSTSPTQDVSSVPPSTTITITPTTTTTISLSTPFSPVSSTTTASTTTTTTTTAASSTSPNTNATTTSEAVSAAAAITTTTTITHTVNAILTVNLPPTSVRLRAAVGSEAWVIGGQQSTFTCRVEGAFPQPIVRWSLGRRELTTQQYPVVVEAGVLESQVVLTPEAGDHGAALTCSAHSPHLPQAALQDHITLTVHFVPVARLRATGLDGDNITVSEGDNVSLVCHLQANPSVYNVTWFHNGRAVFRGVEGARMEVRQVRPVHRGLYTCLASNQVGDGHSNAVNLNVMFRPVCAANQTLQYRRVRGEALTIVCSLLAYPPTLVYTWAIKKTPDSSPERLASVGRKEGLTGRYTLPRLKEERREEQVVQCWARNTEGTQLYPCNFTIFTQI
ncbi:hemicentin-2-like [Portunus trituberculatus]|uniref:hemicentin-2-like n=1 Tax=Portunus trituberculatus TaxID=210409 RepID=UPI001E1CD2DA|nr:hemicentin-2-like [Portunus trituberculatus]